MRVSPWLSTLCAAALLAACGGGGSSSSAGSAGTGSGAAITLTGVVARGAAVVGATVRARCAGGTFAAAAVTDAAGRYSIDLSAASVLPCVLEATPSSAADPLLHSVATTATANITSLTELLVAQITGQLPATYYASATASGVGSTITGSAVSSAQTAVKATLQTAGVDTAALTDLVSGSLSAGSGTGYDGVLDALATALASAGSTLAELTQTVADTAAGSGSGGSGSGTSGSTETAALPADLLLKPQAPNCAWLRSTTYRVIKFAPSLTTGPNDAVTALERLVIDAPTLTVRQADNPSNSWTWTANGNCRYTSADGDDIVVSPSGVVVARAVIDAGDGTVNASARGSARMVIGVPEQAIAVADLAGTWTYLANTDATADAYVEAGSFTIGSDGVWTGYSCNTTIMRGALACDGGPPAWPRLTANAAGGFDMVMASSTENWRNRTFAYRSGSGGMMLVALGAEGSVAMATRQRALVLPTAGSTWSQANLEVNRSGVVVSTAFSFADYAARSVDTETASYVRRVTSPDTGVYTDQSILYNRGGNGYLHRAQAATTNSAGTPLTLWQLYAMPLEGMGVSAFWATNLSTASGDNSHMGLAVRRP